MTPTGGHSLNIQQSIRLAGGTVEQMDIPIPAGQWRLEWFDVGLSAVAGLCRITVQVTRGSITTVLGVGELSAGTIFNGLRGSGELTLMGGDTLSVVAAYGVANQLLQFEAFLRGVHT